MFPCVNKIETIIFDSSSILFLTNQMVRQTKMNKTGQRPKDGSKEKLLVIAGDREFEIPGHQQNI